MYLAKLNIFSALLVRPPFKIPSAFTLLFVFFIVPKDIFSLETNQVQYNTIKIFNEGYTKYYTYKYSTSWPSKKSDRTIHIEKIGNKWNVYSHKK